MNSSGIGLLVTLLIRINREKQRLLTYGLSEHYRSIFQITRLDDAIGIYDSEEEAVGAANRAKDDLKEEEDRHDGAGYPTRPRPEHPATPPTGRATSRRFVTGCRRGRAPATSRDAGR